MARIVKTTEKNRKGFLLKAGLSIFLFLQIQMPDAAELTAGKLENLAFKLCAKTSHTHCALSKPGYEPLAFVLPAQK